MKVNSNEDRIIRNILEEYGCYFGKAGFEILENCRFVVTYNSSFVVDCWMRGVHTYTHVDGTFYILANLLSDDPTVFKRKVNFLMWKYCLPLDLTFDQWVDVFRTYTQSDKMFPLPLMYSWGHWF